MEQVWVVLTILSFIYAGGFGILYRHFTSIYEAQMDITQKLIERVMVEEVQEEE